MRVIDCRFCAGDCHQVHSAQTDTSFIDEHGTAHVTRVVPVPDTLSPEAQKAVSVAIPDTPEPEDFAKRRAQASAWQVNGGEQMRKTYPVNIAEDKIAGVPVRIVTPLTIPADKQNRVLINLHGGGFNADWGSEIESIPVANSDANQGRRCPLLAGSRASLSHRGE